MNVSQESYNPWLIYFHGIEYKEKPKKRDIDYPSGRCNLTKNQRLAVENYISTNCHGMLQSDIYGELLDNGLITDINGIDAHFSIVVRTIKKLRDEGRFRTKSDIIIGLHKSGLEWPEIMESTGYSKPHIQTIIREYKAGKRNENSINSKRCS